MDCGDENFITAGHMWCSYNSWKTIYQEPVIGDSEGLPEECLEQVIGASVNLWTEKYSYLNVLNKLFPRAFALGERLWTNPSQEEDAEKLWISGQQRLRVLNDFNMLNRCQSVA